MKRFKFSWRGARLALFTYILFDLLIGGYCGGFFPLTPAAAGQTAPSIVPFGQSFGYQHRIGSLYMAPGYATWQGTILTGNAATGSQSIIVTANSGGVAGVASLADGTSVPLSVVFNTSTPLTILDGNTETVTPSGVSGPTACPAGFLGVGSSTQCMVVTATFANTHGSSAPIVSGDAGIMEAVTDAGNNGGGLIYWAVDTGIVTLNTGSVTTTTTTKVPSVYISMGGAGRVTTSITTSTSWAVGTATNTTDFCTAQTTLTAGTVCNVVALTSPTYRGTGAISLSAIVFTMGTGAPGAGAVKARVSGFTPVQPAQ